MIHATSLIANVNANAAVRHGFDVCVAMLLERGADITWTEIDGGDTVSLGS